MTHDPRRAELPRIRQLSAREVYADRARRGDLSARASRGCREGHGSGHRAVLGDVLRDGRPSRGAGRLPVGTRAAGADRTVSGPSGWGERARHAGSGLQSLPAGAGNPSVTVSFRDVGPEDVPLLFALYASTREAEMALVPWTAEQKRAFVEMQFAAQQQGYANSYPSR